jgi:hypothetical protein
MVAVSPGAANVVHPDGLSVQEIARPAILRNRYGRWRRGRGVERGVLIDVQARTGAGSTRPRLEPDGGRRTAIRPVGTGRLPELSGPRSGLDAPSRTGHTAPRLGSRRRGGHGPAAFGTRGCLTAPWTMWCALDRGPSRSLWHSPHPRHAIGLNWRGGTEDRGLGVPERRQHPDDHPRVPRAVAGPPFRTMIRTEPDSATGCGARRPGAAVQGAEDEAGMVITMERASSGDAMTGGIVPLPTRVDHAHLAGELADILDLCARFR